MCSIRQVIPSPVALVVKNPTAKAEDIRDAGSVPGSGRSPGEGNSNPLLSSCLENSMDRGGWWATAHRVAKSWMQLKWLSTHARTQSSFTHNKQVQAYLRDILDLVSNTTERLHFHFSLSRIGEGNGNPLQCSCLEDPRDRAAWWATASGVAQSWTQLKQLSSSSSIAIKQIS